MKKQKKHKKSTKNTGTKVLGTVVIEYTQFNVPTTQIEAVAEALSYALSSRYYAQYLVTETYGEDG